MTTTIPESCTHISGYNVFHRRRCDRGGGGAALYTEDSIPVQPLDICTPDDLKCVWLLARTRRLPREVSSAIVAAVYNAPKGLTEERLLDYLVHSITILRGKYPKCGLLICRDFNKSGVAKIARITDQHLVSVVKKNQNTRSQSVLDIIITNLSQWYQELEILPPVGNNCDPGGIHVIGILHGGQRDGGFP